MSTPLPPAALLAELLAYAAPGEPLTLPHGLARALVDGGGVQQQPAGDQGTAPGGDFTAADLRSRYQRSASWVRERFAAGDFGEAYRAGREQVARREAVLAFDDRRRGGTQPALAGALPARPRSSDPVSVVERRAVVERRRSGIAFRV